MPVDENASKKELFDDVRHGKMFKKTARKSGVKKARKQMIARVLETKRKLDAKKKYKKGKHHKHVAMKK